MSDRTKIFISYSHQDKFWFDELKKHLAPYEAKLDLQVWDDERLVAGDDWATIIEAELAAAKVAVLLVSPDFLTSKFIRDNELPPILKAAEDGGCTVAWIALKPSSVLNTHSEISRYQSISSDVQKPISSLRGHKRDEEWVTICQKIADLANR